MQKQKSYTSTGNDKYYMIILIDKKDYNKKFT